MGGLLSAEVVLLPSRNPSSARPLRHRLLGSISFDTPFLGMHPGIIKAGLGSIFKPASKAPTSPQSAKPQSNSYFSSLVDGFSMNNMQSQYYNPTFANDVNLPVRRGWENALHFVNKHSKNLRQATTQLVTSHIEFGSCLADYDGLKIRYCRVRMLEEEEASKRRTVITTRDGVPSRVRFTNYYTASTGRPKKPKPTSEASNSTTDFQRSNSDVTSVNAQHPTTLAANNANETPDYDDISDASSLSSLTELDPIESIHTDTHSTTVTSPSPSPSPSVDLSLPPSFPLSPTPPGPPPLLSDHRNDLPAFKKALKKYHTEGRTYGQALRDYHKLLYAAHKLESQRLSRERKAALSIDASTEPSHDASELDVLAQGNQRIATAPTDSDRKREIKASRDRHKREFDQRKDQLKTQIEAEKARRKQIVEAAKAERKAGKQALRNDIRAEKDAFKELYKAQASELKDAWKRQRCPSRSGSSQAVSAVSVAGLASRDGGGDAAGSLENVRSVGSTSSVATPSRSSSSSAAPPGPPPGPPPGTTPTNGYPPEKRTLSTDTASTTTTSTSTSTTHAHTKPQKDRKFCILPPKDASGNRDPTWARVYMQGVDEVGAHCGLFFPQGAGGEEMPERSESPARSASREPDVNAWGERYARLVGDVAERIEGWVHDDMTERMIRGVEGL